MRDQQASFDALGAVILVVTYERPNKVARFVEREGIPFPVLSDVSRRAYAAFGFQRGRASNIWGWSTVKVYLRDLLAGHLPPLPSGDLAQLGGDIVLDAQGRVVFLHPSRNPADRPTVDTLLAAVRRAQNIEPEWNSTEPFR